MADRIRVAVIGGGMAGCAAARELMRAGRDVTIFDEGPGLGGRARSWHRPEITPDVGVNLWFTSLYRLMFDRIREYGLQDQLVDMSNNIIIVHDGRAAEIRSDSLRTLMTYPHVSVLDRVKSILLTGRETVSRRRLDLFDPIKLAEFDDGETAAEWGRRKLSQRGLDNLLRPAIESFWLWPCEDISAAHSRAMQANVAGTKFYVFRGGMEVVAERMAQGADIRLGTTVSGTSAVDGKIQLDATGVGADSRSETFDAVVVATPAPTAAKLVASLPSELVDSDTRQFLESQRYEPALSVAYLADFSTMPSEAHIVAAGAGDHPVKTIITFPREITDASGRTQRKHLVFVYPGRAETRRLLEEPRDRQFARVSELAPTLWADFPREAEPFEVAARPHAMPVPAPGRYRASARITRHQRGPVVFAGDYFCSPISEAAMRSGIRAAESLISERRAGRVR